MESEYNTGKYGQCRCCLSMGNHQNLHSEYYVNGQREVFVDAFAECFNLFLLNDPRLSTQICATCTNRLRDARSFKGLVLENEKLLLETLDNDKRSQFDDNIFDPLLIKSESASLDVTEDEDFDIEATETQDLTPQYEGRCLQEFSNSNQECEHFIPGEKELLRRFSSVDRLPTRNSLADICPMFCGHLEALKGNEITAQKLQELVQSQANPRCIKKDRNGVVISEKMAHALNTATILQHCNASVFKSKMRSGFPCFYCKQIFVKPKLLREHQTKHSRSQLFKLLTKYTADAIIAYADVTDLKCTICNENMTNIAKFKDHLVKTHNKKLYKNVLDRLIPFKLGDKESNYDCQVCGINFETFGAVERHMNVHYKNFICEECGSGFITKRRLKVHAYHLHNQNSIMSCHECNKTFANQKKYKIHYENVHQKVKKVKCPKCSGLFVDYFTRQRHMEEKHGVEPILYKCTECDKSFNRKYSLTCHFKRLHLFKKDVQCEFCPFMCFSKTELTDHLHTHVEGKSFVCTVCKKTFMRKKTLAVHMRIHTNDIRYSCHMCGETFVQNWRLQSHLKMHIKEYADH